MANDGLESFDELQRNLNKMAKKTNKAAKAALEIGAEMYADGLEKNTPKSILSGKHEHLKDHIVYTKPKVDGEMYVSIGYDKEVAWRVHMTNWGTIKQRPQHFIERTENEFKDVIMAKIQEVYMKGLGL
ncbi:HK97 gp10 family phage protein [Bacillus safensis]|uniref:HK97-gp10 family putative phage morphogenesis protein n=1 Tax=Bacillus safensis TaxID=561879 RepID=UPI00203B4E3C|nr:HK97-gp10 family putative phage morphogenesis protein [Bacillus safensis]MCM3367866.1 HK97 gp10 family phage protein [Bacillus safensis]